MNILIIIIVNIINFLSTVPFKTRVIIYIYIYICFKTQMLFIYCQETRQMLTLEPTNVWILDIYQPITAALTTRHKNGRKLETEVLQKKGASSVTPETWHLINVALPGGSVLHRTSHRFVKRSSVMFCLRRKAALNCQICTMKKKYDAQLRGDWRVSEHVINIKRRLYTPRWHFRAIIVRRKM